MPVPKALYVIGIGGGGGVTTRFDKAEPQLKGS